VLAVEFAIHLEPALDRKLAKLDAYPTVLIQVPPRTFSGLTLMAHRGVLDQIWTGTGETGRSKVMTSLARVALVAGIAIFAAPAAASTTSDIADTAKVTKSTAMQVAQGATPEGWRVEGPPRYKKATSKSKIGEVTKFREEGPPRYKKKSTTTGSGN
jgi:hypothetical protein